MLTDNEIYSRRDAAEAVSGGRATELRQFPDRMPRARCTGREGRSS
ncbi:MAG: hypothetical protein H0X65_22350 [Gemmatimonadetes bacterium]|nr:hypothetical protein [Gemmatimonadota bacterium]